MSKFYVESGYNDAKRGHTCCPYGTEKEVRLWHRGYDLAEKDEVAPLTRFRDLKRRKR